MAPSDSLSTTVLGLTMAVPDMRIGMIGSGRDALICTVSSSTAVTSMVKSPTYLVLSRQTMALPILRSSDFFTAAALKGTPSWKVMPWRNLKRQVEGSTFSQEVAKRGLSSLVFGSFSTSVSTMFCLRTRPSVPELELQPSRLVGSVGSTTLIHLSVTLVCAVAGAVIRAATAKPAAAQAMDLIGCIIEGLLAFRSKKMVRRRLGSGNCGSRQRGWAGPFLGGPKGPAST